MKQLLTICLLLVVVACKNSATDAHAHNPDGSHPGEPAAGSLSYTMYSEKSEMFVEFKPLVVGSNSRFAVHLTRLGETFLPYTEGRVTVSLIQGDKGIKQAADSPASPGIFQLTLQPVSAGAAKLVFDIETAGITDHFVIDSLQVYANEQTAIASETGKSGNSDISFLKEQAWKSEFANQPVTRKMIFDVLKTTGEILSAPGDEVMLAAKSNGVVKFTGSNTVIGSPVKTGFALFSITGGNIPFENVEATKQSAVAELAAAKTEFERTSELIRDKLITQGEFQQAKLRYEQAQIALANLGRNYSSAGRTVTAPSNGFIKSILVSEGQYVTAGQALASITKNQRLLLKINVPLRDAEKVNNIKAANFNILQGDKLYSSTELNSKLIAVARSASDNAPFIPVNFEIDNKHGLLAGSFAEVFLKTSPIANALVIPVSALTEDQGLFYAYVQTAGESFQKREIKLGANDGQQVQVVAGLSEGERVVVKGAYQIKLSQASGSLPAHGHEH